MVNVLTTQEYQAIGKKRVVIMLTDDNNGYYSVFECNELGEIFGQPLFEPSSLDECIQIAEENIYNITNESDLPKVVHSIGKKDQIESMLISIVFASIGMDIPSNIEEIVQFCYEDVCDTADKDNWHSGDVIIAFRRWIESKAMYEG